MSGLTSVHFVGWFNCGQPGWCIFILWLLLLPPKCFRIEGQSMCPGTDFYLFVLYSQTVILIFLTINHVFYHPGTAKTNWGKCSSLNEPDWHSSDLHMSICTARIGSIFHLLIEFVNVLGTRVPQSPFFITWPNLNFLTDPAGPACSLLQRQFLCLDSSYNREVNVIFSFINFFMRNIMRI